MERRSFLSWALSCFGLLAASEAAKGRDPVLDVTNFTSDGCQENVDGFTARAAVEADSLKVKCGSLEIISPSGAGRDTALLIDGKPVAAKSVTLSVDVKGVWHVGIVYMPCIGLYGENMPKRGE